MKSGKMKGRIRAGVLIAGMAMVTLPVSILAQAPAAVDIPPGQPPVPRIPQGVSLAKPISEDDAVAIALWNNAAFQADAAALGIARADLLEAGLLRNPILQMLLPIGYKQFEMLLNMPAEVFWQRPRRVAAAKIEYERAAKGLEQNGLNLIRDVRLACSELRLAKDRHRLSQERVELLRQIATLAASRLRAGDISEMDANLIQVDLVAAEEQAARNARDTAQARIRLAFLLGLESEKTTLDIQSDPSDAGLASAGDPTSRASIEALLADAFAHRPELRGAVLAIEAAAAKAKWERSRLFAFAGLLSIKQGAGLDFSPRGGFLMELPVFNRNQGGITRADAEVERAGRQYLAVRHRISQEVSEAHTHLQQTAESLGHYRTRILPQVLEGSRLAEAAYRGGDESYLFVLQANRQLVDARFREAELSHELRCAVAQVDRGIGRKRDAKN